MAPPSLADYQGAANAIYDPQQASDTIALQNTYQTTVNTLEASKGQINTDYQSAITNLQNTVQSNTGKIDQLYAEKLGGNFSGLEGNDMGQMFAKADQQQATIESTRANKLATISTGEANAQITMQSSIDALTPKYQALKATYAQSNYAAAVKEYNTTAYQQEELGLRQESIDKVSQSTVNQDALAQLNSIYQSKFTAKGAQGKDSYVSPTTYNNLLAAYQAAGGTATQFKDAFSGYANPNQKTLYPSDVYNGL
jgi:hypothetical protein